ncbi:MAG TPA: hypothetical protein VF755_10550, partial [Catenuloplanes sp.]
RVAGVGRWAAGRAGPRLVVAALLVGGALTGCGVQPTGVVSAGAPAEGVRPPPSYRFFVIGERIRPMPSDPELERTLIDELLGGRPVGVNLDQLSPEARLSVAIGELARGPGAAEKKLGASTAVPRTKAIKVVTAGGGVSVTMPGAAPQRLSPLAAAQISCTVTSVRRAAVAGWVGQIDVADGLGGQRSLPPCPEADLAALPVGGERARG